MENVEGIDGRHERGCLHRYGVLGAQTDEQAAACACHGGAQTTRRGAGMSGYNSDAEDMLIQAFSDIDLDGLVIGDDLRMELYAQFMNVLRPCVYPLYDRRTPPPLLDEAEREALEAGAAAIDRVNARDKQACFSYAHAATLRSLAGRGK